MSENATHYYAVNTVHRVVVESGNRNTVEIPAGRCFVPNNAEINALEGLGAIRLATPGEIADEEARKGGAKSFKILASRIDQPVSAAAPVAGDPNGASSAGTGQEAGKSGSKASGSKSGGKDAADGL